MTSPTPNLAAVRALIDDAKPVPSVCKEDPQPGAPRGDTMPGQWTPNQLGLPPECPVTPLGVDGERNWFLDPIGQLCCYSKPYGQADTLELFRGRHLYLYWAWPKWTSGKERENPDVDGWKNERAREALIAAATAKGPWSSVEKVRGRGCWRGEDGKLLLHCGDVLLAGARGQPPGEIGGHVYPTRAPLMRPWPGPIDDQKNPARLLRPLLSSWSWQRPDVDPHLLLGWIGCAFLGPALAWRSNVYLTGDAGMGKSTLQALIKGLLGDWLIDTTNTTAAGIYQHVGQDGLAVAVDEFEGKDDNRAAAKILELARQASSGGQGLRGGDRGTGSEFCIRSAFLFSSINTPPLKPQDVSRFALLKLQRLKPTSSPFALDMPNLNIIGRTVLRRLVSQFHRFEATLQAFRDELADAGMDPRGQMQFGTLLACADLIEHDGWDADRLKVPTESGDLKRWAELLDVRSMAEFEDRTQNWLNCLNRMLSVPVDAWRNGTRWTVGQILEDWHAQHEDFGNDVKRVRSVLGQAGLGLIRRGRVGGGDWLAVPNNNPILQRLFEGSDWVGSPGAGVWAGALRQSPPGEVHEVDDGMRINGVKSRCTLIRLDALYGPDGIMGGSKRPDPAGDQPAAPPDDPDLLSLA